MKSLMHIGIGAAVLITCTACNPVNEENKWFYEKCMRKELSVNRDFIYSAMIEGALEGGMTLDSFCKCMTRKVTFTKNDKGKMVAKGVTDAAEDCFIDTALW